MVKTGIIPKIFTVSVAAVILVLIARNLIKEKVAPTFEEFVASSTAVELATDAATSSIDLNASPSPTPSPVFLVTIHAPKGELRVEVADTPEGREKGLGGRKSMPSDQGMVFVFYDSERYGFWMKDMEFSLDMVWIGPDHRILGIMRNISPETYPTVFYPPAPARYVLELNAGAAEKMGLATGTELFF